MQDYFPKMILKPNPSCSNKHCVNRQLINNNIPLEKFLLNSIPKNNEIRQEKKENEWGIECVGTSEERENKERELSEQMINKFCDNDNNGKEFETIIKCDKNNDKNGVEFAYMRSEDLNNKISENDVVKVDKDADLGDLMNELNGL